MEAICIIILEFLSDHLERLVCSINDILIQFPLLTLAKSYFLNRIDALQNTSNKSGRDVLLTRHGNN